MIQSEVSKVIGFSKVGIRDYFTFYNLDSELLLLEEIPIRYSMAILPY